MLSTVAELFKDGWLKRPDALTLRVCFCTGWPDGIC
ncbi:hypothetical protein MJ8_15620 [Mesorhizobium sp. J8]|nr:hypothetical protein MJ8_15620 [Mesorhizobium sp. J8]